MSRSSPFDWDKIKILVEHPHLIGLMAGKKLLTEEHSRWIIWMHNTKEDSLLQASRGSYKTTAVIEIGLIYRLMRDPNATMAIVRKSYTAAAEVVKAVCEIMEMPVIKELLTFVWFADKNGRIPDKAEWHFTTRKEGKINLSIRTDHTPECTLEALGLDSKVTGRHYSGCIMLDDITDINDRIYKSEREYTKIIVSEIRANIASPGCVCLFSGTAWHPSAALEELKDNGIRQMVLPYQVLPFMSPEKIELARRAQGPLLFACNYELRFDSDADRIFTDPVTGKWDFAHAKNIKAHIDAAYSSPGDKDRDYCALTIMCELPNNKIGCIGWIEQIHAKDWIPFIFEQMGKYKAKILYAEENGDKGFLLDLIAGDPRARALGIFTESYVEKSNKETKIATIGYEGFKNTVFAEEGDPMYLEQILSWNEKDKSCHNDASDSMASLYREGGYVSMTNSMNLYNPDMWNEQYKGFRF